MRRTGAFGENHIAADYMLSSVSAHVEYLVSRERTRPDWSRRLSAFWSLDSRRALIWMV